MGVEFAAGGEVGVAADLASEVVFGFAVLGKWLVGKGKERLEVAPTRESQIERGLMWRFIR